MSVAVREKIKSNGEVSLYLDIYHQGKRSYEFLGLYLNKDRTKNKEVRRIAEDIRSMRQLELSSGKYNITPSHMKETNFLTYFEVSGKEKGRTWNSTLLHLKDYAGDRVTFEEIDERWLIGFQKHLLNAVSINSAVTYFNKVKAALNLALRDGYIQSNPVKRIDSIKKRETTRTYLTENEIRQLVETPANNHEVKKAFLFACFSGLRLSDVAALKWRNIQDEQIVLRVKKTKEPLHLPLSKSANNMLGKRGEQEELIFNLYKSHWAIWDTVQKWAVAASIDKHISFHTSRHTFATLALTKGVDLYVVSKLLGHTDIKNTQIYAKIVDEKKQNAVNLLPEISL